MKTKLLILLLLTMSIPVGCGYTWDSSDNSDRLSSNQSGVFSPGYVNAAKQQAYSVLNQSKPKNFWENLVEKVKNKTSNKVAEHANVKVVPEIKQKASAKQTAVTTATTKNIITTVENITTTSTITTSTAIQSQYGAVAMGDGSSRIIDNIPCHFVGFGNSSFGTINDAMAAANAGDRIIINSGSYSEDIFVKDGVSLFGITQSGNPLINGRIFVYNNTTKPIEINGLQIFGGVDVQGSSWVTIQNNRIYGQGNFTPAIACNDSNVSIIGNYITNSEVQFDPWHSPGIYGINSFVDIRDNEIFETGRGVWLENGIGSIHNNFFWRMGFEAIHTGAYESFACIQATDNTFYGLSPLGAKAIAGFTSNWNNTYVIGDVFEPIWGSLYQEWSQMGIPLDNGGIVLTAQESQINPYAGIYESYEPYGYHLQGPKIASYFTYDITTISYEDVITSHEVSTPFTSYSTELFYSEPTPITFASTITPNITYDDIQVYAENESLSGILKGLLSNKDALTALSTGTADMDGQLIASIVGEPLNKYAIATPLSPNSRSQDMDIAFILAKILKNPTEDQKLVLYAVESLLADIKAIQEKAGASPELARAETDLLQIVAAVLLVQGVPDLLKTGDIDGVKGIFSDLGASKDKILLDYSESVKPYYENIVKELTANLAMLQLKGMLSGKLTEEELRKMKPVEIDKILERIQRSNDRSLEIKRLLEKNADYRKTYLDPQNKALEANIRLMLNEFTGKINKAIGPRDN